MLLLWILMSLATASPPSTPTVPVSVKLPEGVKVAPVAREMVSDSRSASVSFAVKGKPAIHDGMLVVTGVLKNAGKKDAKIFLVSAPHTGGPFVLGPRGVVYKKEVTEGPTSPDEVVLPAGGEVVYEAGLVLADWEWPEGGAEVDWSFQFWTEPATGTLPGRLSPPN